MLRRTCNIFIALIVVCAIALVAILGIPLITGNKLYAVQTGSMEPKYPIGSIVVVGPVEAEDVAVGDVITFELSSASEPVTHRVIDIDPQERLFYTKGDNNDTADFYPVPFANLMGRVSYHIPKLGHVVSGIRTPAGILVVLWIALLIVVLLLLPDLVDKRRQYKAEERRQAQEERRKKLNEQRAAGGEFPQQAATKAAEEVKSAPPPGAAAAARPQLYRPPQPQTDEQVDQLRQVYKAGPQNSSWSPKATDKRQAADSAVHGKGGL